MPQYPNGTCADFLSIDSTGAAAFLYVLGRNITVRFLAAGSMSLLIAWRCG